MTDAPVTTCATCRKDLTHERSFAMRALHGFHVKCTRCSLVDRILVVRSTTMAAIVGTLMLGLNQGDAIVAGTFTWSASWYKVPLTYAVPFFVATYGALSNGYRPAGWVEEPGAED